MTRDYEWDIDVDDEPLDRWDDEPVIKKNTLKVKMNPAQKLVNIKCPSCGGKIQVDQTKKRAYCPYCGNSYDVQEAIAKVEVSFHNADQFGHDFENGRIKAQRTNREIILGTYSSKKPTIFNTIIITSIVIGILLAIIFIPLGLICLAVEIIVYKIKPAPIHITMSNERIIVKSYKSRTDIPLRRISSIHTTKNYITFQLVDKLYSYHNIENAEALKNDFYRYMKS